MAKFSNLSQPNYYITKFSKETMPNIQINPHTEFGTSAEEEPSSTEDDSNPTMAAAAATVTSIVLKKEKIPNQSFLGSTMVDIRNMQAGFYSTQK